MAEQEVEHEICGNCKKEIPHYNYVMHTAHCARNITLCKVCKEPVPKSQYEEHVKTCVETPKRQPKPTIPKPPLTNIEKSSYFQARKEIQDKKQTEKRERYLERHEKFLGTGHSMKNDNIMKSMSSTSYNQKSVNAESYTPNSASKHNSSSSISHSVPNPAKPLSNGTGAIRRNDVNRNPAESVAPKPNNGLLACRYCDLELPKMELEEHENYCGSRTDKCMECGELVMYKYRQMHLDTNHGFLKLNEEAAPKPSWDSNTQRSTNNVPSSPPRRRFEPTIYTDFSQFDPTDYLPSNYRIPKPKIEKGESYKEISRRLDCKTEYIRNLLHDSASITAPLRHNGTVPRNHFNHNKGPAPQPPSRRRNPPTELCIPCEFCDTPIPHEDLIQHETGCRPDLARLNLRSRRRQSLEDDDYTAAPSPEVELPCEFCADMIPASQLLRHQSSCG